MRPHLARSAMARNVKASASTQSMNETSKKGWKRQIRDPHCHIVELSVGRQRGLNNEEIGRNMSFISHILIYLVKS